MRRLLSFVTAAVLGIFTSGVALAAAEAAAPAGEGSTKAALAIATGLGILVRSIGSHDLVPPEIDASNHGFFVARVVETQSLDLRHVAGTAVKPRFASETKERHAFRRLD